MKATYKYPPFVQLLICIGLYILFTFSFYGIAIGYILPHYYGISAIEFSSGNYSDPGMLHIMKVFQLAYSIFAFLIPALIFFAVWHKKPLQYAGLSSDVNWGWVLFAIIILFASLPAVGLLSDWNQLIHFGPFDEKFRAMQERAKTMTEAFLNMPKLKDLWVNLLLIAIIPAIAEEFFFRGAVQRIFIKLVHHAWIGILITSIFFSLVHGEMLGFFPRVALGMILGLIYYYTGNLWYAVIVHLVNNGFQVVVVYLYQHDYLSTDITQNTPTPVILGVASIIVVIALFFIFKKYVPTNPKQVMWKNKTQEALF